jgi:hypothetical protein
MDQAFVIILLCSSCNPAHSETGNDFLTRQGIDHETDWDLWRNIMAIGIIAIGMECLAYVQLRRMKKLK